MTIAGNLIPASPDARRVMAVFFIHGALLAQWVLRIPDIEADLGLGPADLAVAILGMPVGTFLALVVAGRIVETLTPRRTILLAGGVYCAIMSLPGWATSSVSLFLTLLLLGAVFVLVDIAQNVEAAAIERAHGRRIISTCHGYWSLGSMVGALIGAGFAQIAVSPRWHWMIFGVVTLPLLVLVARSLPRVRPGIAATRAVSLSLPTVAMIGLVTFAFGISLAEITTRTWGAVFLREVIAASPLATGVAYAAFSLAMAGARFLGDAATDRFGGARVARACSLAALVGGIMTVAAPSVPAAALGLAVLGLGLSLGYPLAVRAAANRGDRPSAVNVSALALVAFSSSLVGPLLVGFIAENGGMRLGMAVILPLLALSVFLAGEVAGSDRPVDAPQPHV